MKTGDQSFVLLLKIYASLLKLNEEEESVESVEGFDELDDEQGSDKGTDTDRFQEYQTDCMEGSKHACYVVHATAVKECKAKGPDAERSCEVADLLKRRIRSMKE